MRGLVRKSRPPASRPRLPALLAGAFAALDPKTSYKYDRVLAKRAADAQGGDVLPQGHIISWKQSR